jgi:hypothetical protein
VNANPSLDERYLDFCARSGAIFAAYPQLEALRHTVFKELLVRRRADGWRDHVKRWVRPLVKRGRTRAPTRDVDVLLWVENQREVIVDALLPVYRELVARDVSVELISFRGPPGMPCARVFDFPARALAPQWAPAAWEALCDCEPGLREQALKRSFYHACAMLGGLYDELHSLLEAAMPKVVLCASTQATGGAALMVASRQLGFRSLLLQHGMMQPVYTPLIADRMLTWGPTSNEILVSLGLPPEKLLTVGSPRHDVIGPSGSGHARAELLSALSLRDRPTFVFFSNGNDLLRNGHAPAECSRWLEALAAEHANDLNVVVRLHPDEDGALYRGSRHLVISKEGVGLSTTLEGSDWIGSLCSTALHDGLLFGKPAWQFYADGWPILADNWRQGLAHRVSSEQQLRNLVQGVLSRGTPRRVDEELVARVFANHGQATQAVADVVLSTLRPQPTPLRVSQSSRAGANERGYFS